MPRVAVPAASGTPLGRICVLRRAILRGEYAIEPRLDVVVERLLAELRGVPGCRRRRAGA